MKAIATLLCFALPACTAEQSAQWWAWHAQDPNAAEQFASDLPDPPAPQPLSGRGVWDRLAQCESGGNWGISTGNGFYGGLQFTLTSWRAVGGTGYPHHASRETQIQMAERLLDIQGWSAWPACSRRLGLR